MAFDVYKLPGIKCPECGDTNTLRVLIAQGTDDDDVVICKQCEKLEVEIVPSDLAAIIQEILAAAENWGDLTEGDIQSKVVEVLELDK